mmetsp:Transcript_5946/g.8566  ORF Transcript_5946/g.8566 Transcript_5946/m.8566 type:complete len:179 (-) Transcript_5946:398-934(-)|eukprot:CAMPEP_0195526408 /NCGR_PEP_ID=MMETSP0794_2-20130614/27457_1 /TAXON_ID=515487 /ORGANISM="Stephanopyxis turris, Strain CCMP 815" /LENGTH=178 /DNA_ID=CAMNT_0040657083 /DNA_START=119 /DNA_END=655 /DNA_ORIENTATION=-
MSEESKIDSNYVNMDSGSGIRPGTSAFTSAAGLDDPNLSQEDKDLRLAIALQQQENAQAKAISTARVKQAEKSNFFRTGRSGVNTRLAAVRDKDQGKYSVPAYHNDDAYVKGGDDYLPPAGGVGGFSGTPQEMSDHVLAQQLQKAEETISVSSTVRKEEEISKAQVNRTSRSGQQAFH